jgi:hypothetical protein
LIGHISVDELASYRAGVVSPSRAARITAHLAGCATCAAVDTQLAGVSALLASVPVPTMPDRLTDQLSAALAAESVRRAAQFTVTAQSTVTVQAAESAQATVTTESAVTARIPGRANLPERAVPAGRRQRWKRPRLTDWSSPLLLRGLAATGVFVLLAGGGYMLANLAHSPSTAISGSPAAAPKHAAAGSNPPSNSNQPPGASSPDVRYKYKDSYLTTKVVESSNDYTKSDLASGIRAQVASAPAIVPAPSVPTTRSIDSGRIKISQLAGCLSRFAAERQILLVDVARYLGRPATIIVLQPVRNTFDVIVVGLACAGSDSDVITRLTVPKS